MVHPEALHNIGQLDVTAEEAVKNLVPHLDAVEILARVRCTCRLG
jgi:hypothetical protein